MLNLMEQFVMLSPSIAGITIIILIIGCFAGTIYLFLWMGDIYEMVRKLKRR